jgi:hypothetical protein
MMPWWRNTVPPGGNMLITHTEIRRHPLWQIESQKCLSVREHLARANRSVRRQQTLAAVLAALGILLATFR